MINKQKIGIYIVVLLLFTFYNTGMAQVVSDDEIAPLNKEEPINSKFSIGFEIGANINYLITNVSDLNATKYTSMKGVNFGVPILYKANDWFSIKATPSILEKNYSMLRTGYYTGIYRDTKNTYLQLPVMGECSFGGEKIKGYIDLGGYAAYWNSSQIKGAMPNILNQPQYGTYINNTNTYSSTIFQDYNAYNYDEKYQFNTIVDNRIELGLIIGGGISYELNENGKIYIDTKYYYATTDQQKNYQQGLVPKYNETYAFSVGYLYQLKKKVSTKKAKLTKKTTITDDSINN